MNIIWDDPTTADRSPSDRIAWDDETPSTNRKIPAAFAFIRSALDTATEALPPVAIGKLVNAKRALQEFKAGHPERAQRIAEQEHLKVQAIQEHPIATGLGTAVGAIPSLMAAGAPATVAVDALPQTLSHPVVRSALKEGFHLGLAAALRGHPEEIPSNVLAGTVLGPLGRITNPLLRIPAGAGAFGALSAAMAPPGEQLHAGAIGAGLGGLATLGGTPRSLPSAPPASTRPGFLPESVWIPAEPVTIEEASQAAREAFSQATQPRLPHTQLSYEPVPPSKFSRIQWEPAGAIVPVSTRPPPPQTAEGFGMTPEAAEGLRETVTRLPETEALIRAAEQARVIPRPLMPRAILAPGEGLTKEQVPPYTKSGYPLRPELQPPEGQEIHPRTTLGNEKGFVALPEEDAQPAMQEAAAAAAIRTVPQLQERVDALAKNVQRTAERLQGLTPASKLAMQESETIAQTGTLSPSARAAFHAAGASPETQQMKFSQTDIERSQAEIVSLTRQVRRLRADIEVHADDPFVVKSIQMADDLLNQATERFRALRFAAGRAVKTFDLPPDVLADLHASGRLLAGVKSVRERLPIYTDIVEKMKRFSTLLPQEREQLGNDFLNAYRLNVFPLLSFARDLVANATELGLQGMGAVGRDLGQLTRGYADFPNLSGFFRGIRNWHSLTPEITEGIGAVAGRVTQQEAGTVPGGLRGAGAFTRRLTPGTAAVDYLVGSPLYLKGVIDLNARRLGALSELWARAGEEANLRGLTGLEKRQFLERFVASPPMEVIDTVIREGNKAGFNRPLGSLARAYTGNPVIKLLVDAFPRWPMQFVKAAGEWVGVYNPELLTRLKLGQATREDLLEYLAKTATGIGGLWWLNRTVYDHVDFRSMEYVKDNGNRIRLSNFDPVTTALWALTLLRGEPLKSWHSLKYASIPFGRFADTSGGSGVLSAFLNVLQQVGAQGQVDPGGIQRELYGWANSAIPGQAIFAIAKAVSDPISREGIGANLPGISQTRRPVINRATGKPLAPKQNVFGIELPALSGTTVPGGERVLDPVTQMLSKFGLLVYRGIKSPIAGVPSSEIPADRRREWQIELGKQRQQRLLPLATSIRWQQVEVGTPEYERLRTRVQDLDAQAAKQATRLIQQRYPGKRKLPRQPSVRERLQ